MPVQTRSKNGDSENSQELKLDKLIDLVQGINDRLEHLESIVDRQKMELNSISDIALKATGSESINEACGVDPKQVFRSNQLLGELSKKKENEDAEARKLRKEKQAFGSTLFSAYVVVYLAILAASFLDLVPVSEIESYPYSWFRDSSSWFQKTMIIPVVMSGLYVFVIFGIQRIMADREPFKLKNSLAMWSLGLALFSFVGSIRTVPQLFFLVKKYGWHFVICGDTRRDWVGTASPAGFWVFIFIISKIPELVDTLFIVLKKKKLITLHWYHHITVMLFCWHSWATHCLYGIFFAAMNLTVHALMYFFYFLAALGYRPTSFAQSITVIQILQMFIGTGITFYTTYVMTFVTKQDMLGTLLSDKFFTWTYAVEKEFDDSDECKVNPANALAGMAMYSSYLWLFCVFFYNAYLRKPSQKKLSIKKAQ